MSSKPAHVKGSLWDLWDGGELHRPKYLNPGHTLGSWTSMRKGSLSTPKMRPSVLNQTSNKLPQLKELNNQNQTIQHIQPVQQSPFGIHNQSFVLRSGVITKMQEYNSLYDRNLKRYFRNNNIQNVLVGHGIVDEQGYMVSNSKRKYPRNFTPERSRADKVLPILTTSSDQNSLILRDYDSHDVVKERPNQTPIPTKTLKDKFIVLQDLIYYKESQKKSYSRRESKSQEKEKEQQFRTTKSKLKPMSSSELQNILQKFKAKVAPPITTGGVIPEETNGKESEREQP